MKYVVKAPLKKMREAKGFNSQGKFAKYVGIDKKFISHCESGGGSGELILRRIAQALGLGTDWKILLKEEENE